MSGDQGGVEMGRSAHDPAVGIKPAALGEIQRIAGEIGDEAPGFLGDERAGGVVPDAFDVARLGGQAEVDVGVAAGEQGVFALAVDADGRSDASGPCVSNVVGGGVLASMGGFDAFGDSGGAGRLDAGVGDVDFDLSLVGFVEHHGACAFDGPVG